MIKFLKKIFDCEDREEKPAKAQYPFIYPKNPKFNGNYCAGLDGVNIYDHIGNNGEIDWDSVQKAHKDFEDKQHELFGSQN